MACRDVAADRIFGGGVEGAGGLARLLVVAADPLQHETPGGSGIGGIAMRRVLQHGGKRLGDGAVGAQEIGERDRAGAGIPVQDTRVQAGLAVEGGVEAGWVDRSEEQTSELQSLMRISYAVLCL